MNRLMTEYISGTSAPLPPTAGATAPTAEATAPLPPTEEVTAPLPPTAEVTALLPPTAEATAIPAKYPGFSGIIPEFRPISRIPDYLPIFPEFRPTSRNLRKISHFIPISSGESCEDIFVVQRCSAVQ